MLFCYLLTARSLRYLSLSVISSALALLYNRNPLVMTIKQEAAVVRFRNSFIDLCGLLAVRFISMISLKCNLRVQLPFPKHQVGIYCSKKLLLEGCLIQMLNFKINFSISSPYAVVFTWCLFKLLSCYWLVWSISATSLEKTPQNFSGCVLCYTCWSDRVCWESWSEWL